MREKEYQEKVVLITGGANGIGRCLVETYANHGATTIFTDIDRENGNDLQNGLQNQGKKVYYRYLNHADLNAVELFLPSLIEEFEDLQIVINNVGVSMFKTLLEVTTKEFVEIQNINLTSGFILAREWTRYREMEGKIGEYGRMIFISSTRNLMSEAASEAYAASKGAIVSLTHALAVSLSHHNLTVNAISPGWIETGDYSKLTSQDHQQHPSQRVGKPEDIASLCLYLTQKENDFINGQNLYVDGGMTKKMIYVDS